PASRHGGRTKEAPFPGLSGADDGTRTHDLLHGKRVVSGAKTRLKFAWLSERGRFGVLSPLSAVQSSLQGFLGVWAARSVDRPNSGGTQVPRLCCESRARNVAARSAGRP